MISLTYGSIGRGYTRCMRPRTNQSGYIELSSPIDENSPNREKWRACLARRFQTFYLVGVCAISEHAHAGDNDIQSWSEGMILVQDQINFRH